jgi:Fic family protein
MTTKPDEVNIYALDAAYSPFPNFKEWAAQAVVDPVRWERYNSSLKTRAESLSPDVLDRARNIAKRAAALDTGAIEGLYEVDRGFTFTVAFETAAWEVALEKKGEHVRSLFEAQLHAYDYVLDLATKAEPISEAAIRALHEEVCRAQPTYRVMTAVGPQEQPLPKGQYKALPNHVRTRKGTDHSYAPVDVTPAEMARFVKELRSDEFRSAHPVVQSSYAHYAFVVIHPFADGNGRVARALASAFTYRAISMPIVILSEDRDSYLSALENADKGDYQSFVGFMLERCLDTIQLVDDSVLSARAPTAEQSLAAINKLYLTKGGYTYEQIDQAGMKLLQAIDSAVKQTTVKVTGPRIGFASGAGGGNVVNAVPPGYRLSQGNGIYLQVAFSSIAPAVANVTRAYQLFLPKDADGDDDVQLFRSDQDKFTARVNQLISGISGVLQIRINMFGERLVNEMLVDLRNKAAQTMR